MLPEKQVDFCIGIINRYRRELPLLRVKATNAQQQNEKFHEEVTYWKNKYQEEKLERERLKKEITILKDEIEKLTKTNNRYQVALFDHGNFTQRTEGKKKPNGGQMGHGDTNKDSQRNYSAFTKQRIYTKTCGRCGRTLARVKSVKQKILLDMQITTQTVQTIVESERQWCGNCHKEILVYHPQSLPFTEYGINTFMVVLHLRFKGKQSHATIATTLHGLFGLEISGSGVGALLTQAKAYLQGTYDELKIAIQKGDIMYNDETGWAVSGKNAWMWIMANEEKTVYVAAESRGKGIMEKMYGNSQSYSMHDGYGGYTNTIPKEKQLYCWAHFLRFVHEETILSKKDSPEWLIKEKLVLLYQQIRSHPEYSKEQKERFLSKEMQVILSIKPENKIIKHILHRFKAQKDGLVRALLVTRDGTNNLAERELRPLAISRNISYGSGSYAGMETTAVLASITQTITRDRTKQYFPTLTSYLREGIQKKYSQYKHIPLFAT